MSAHLEAQLGSLIAGGGIVWIALVAAPQLGPAAGISFPSGPIELSAVGILLWLHAKWRGSVRRV
jgi:hypothetical protein